jgi:hypothetical protein
MSNFVEDVQFPECRRCEAVCAAATTGLCCDCLEDTRGGLRLILRSLQLPPHVVLRFETQILLAVRNRHRLEVL